MDRYLWEALESDLVISKLGKVEDYLPVDAPLLNYLVTDTEDHMDGSIPISRI